MSVRHSRHYSRRTLLRAWSSRRAAQGSSTGGSAQQGERGGKGKHRIQSRLSSPPTPVPVQRSAHFSSGPVNVTVTMAHIILQPQQKQQHPAALCTDTSPHFILAAATRLKAVHHCDSPSGPSPSDADARGRQQTFHYIFSQGCILHTSGLELGPATGPSSSSPSPSSESGGCSSSLSPLSSPSVDPS